MIEDKELGLKVAESHKEEIWEKQRESCENEIKVSKDIIMINEAFLKLCENKLNLIQKEKDRIFKLIQKLSYEETEND